MKVIAVLTFFAGVASPERALAQAAPPTRTPEVEASLAQARGLSRAFNFAASTISPSVVHITQVGQVPEGGFFEPVRVVERPIGAGSGVVVSAEGYILTNHHVLQAPQNVRIDSVRVKFADGREVEGTIVGSDAETDLGVVRVDPSQVPLVAAGWGDSESLEVGEWVLAVGSPFGEYDNTVTAGIVSAKNRTGLQKLSEQAYQDFIQTDAAINPGNSGGPLVNLEGKIVGINSQIATRGVAQSAGIGFSIPASIARPVMESIVRTGRAQRGWMGVQMAEIPAAERTGALSGGGVRIEGVISRGPADRAGLRKGDVIVRAAGRPVESVNRLRNAVALTIPGESLEFEVMRDGEPRTLRVNVLDRLAGLALLEGGKAIPRFGFAVESLTPESLQRLGLRSMGRGRVEGVIVTQVDPFGPAAQASDPLKEGDIIVQIGRTAIPDARTFDSVVEDTRRDTVRFFIVRPRSGERGFIELTPRE